MKKKPITPYQRLQDRIRKFCYEITIRKRKLLCLQKGKDITAETKWDVLVLLEWTRMAQNLGYVMELRVTADGDLAVECVEEISIPRLSSW